MGFWFYLAVTLFPISVQAKCASHLVSPLNILEQSKEGIRRAQEVFPIAMSDEQTAERWKWLSQYHGYRIRLMGPEALRDKSYSETVLAWSDHDKSLVELNPKNPGDFSKPSLGELTFMHEVSDSTFYHRAYRWQSDGWVLTDRMREFLEAVKGKFPNLAKIAGIKPKKLDDALLMYFRERESFLYVTRFVQRAREWKINLSPEIEEVKWAVLEQRDMRKAVIEHLEAQYDLSPALSGILWNEKLPASLAW